MTKPEAAQSVAHALATAIVGAVSAQLHRSEKPENAGPVVTRECLAHLDQLRQLEHLPAKKVWFDDHVQSIATAVVRDIESRGAPHSFVAPTWQRDGATLIGDATVSAGDAIIRAVVFEEPNYLPRVAVLWAARFAG